MPFRIAILLVFEIAAAVGTLLQPYWGLMLLIALLYVRPQDDRPNMQALHFPLVITISVVLATAARFAVLQPRIGLTLRRLAPFLPYYFLISISALVSGTLEASYQIERVGLLVGVSGLLILWIDRDSRLLMLLGTMLASGLVYVKYGIFNPTFLRSSIEDTEYLRLHFRNLPNFGNPNFLALLMALMLFIALSLLVARQWGWIKIFLLAAAVGYLFVFLRCQSRGASVAFACAAFAFWLMNKRKILVAVSTTVVVGTGLLFFAPATYLERLESMMSYQSDASATDRLELWNKSVDLIATHPLFGIGPDNFGYHTFNSAHNTYLQVAAEVGLPGLLAYLFLLLYACRNAWRARKLSAGDSSRRASLIHAVSGGMIASLAMVTIQGFFNGFAYREFLLLLFATTVCVRNLAEEPEGGPQTPEELMPAAESPEAAPARF